MYLQENPVAGELHAEGLQASLDGDFARAHTLILGAIEEARPAGEVFEPSSIDNSVQLARILRDGGFAFTREALATGNPALLGNAAFDLVTASDMTRRIIDRRPGEPLLSFEDSRRFHGDVHLHNAAIAEVFAEHGATLGLLGRTATARAVLLGIDTRGDGATATWERNEEQKWYNRHHAHGALKQGNNGYYLVSNAMNGARQEIINGQHLRAGKWLVRAVEGLAWTAQHDRRNLAAAQKTFAGRLPHLRSHGAAKASVFVKP